VAILHQLLVAPPASREGMSLVGASQSPPHWRARRVRNAVEIACSAVVTAPSDAIRYFGDPRVDPCFDGHTSLLIAD
jgi:hypothetical protein